MLGGQPPRPPGRDYACHTAGQKAAFSAGRVGFCPQVTLKRAKGIHKVASRTQGKDRSGDG